MHSRRDLLRHIFYSGGALAAGPLLQACGSNSGGSGSGGGGGLPGGNGLPLEPGPLMDIGALRDSGVDRVFIPEGFEVRRVAAHLSNPVTGLFDPFGASGYVWHQAPDGGAVYAAEDGGWVYVCNSEVNIGGSTFGSSRDGGVGALRFDAEGNVVDAYRILDGTRRNCAGGTTPWGSWISCEETGDGYAWECFPFGTSAEARRLDAAGRFNREAACVDLAERTVYYTEDNGEGRFYRFVCEEADLDTRGESPRLRMESGRLQVMEVEGFEADGYIESDSDARALRRVRWTDVADVTQPQGTVRATLAEAGMAIPGTRFRGGEGLWLYEVPAALQSVPPGGDRPMRAVAFFATKGDNRVYAYDIDNGLIQSVFDNDFVDPDFDDVDNVVVSPAGDVVVAEDGDGMRLIVVHPGMPARTLLQIDLPGSEITGPAFTPDGSRLYFNSQRGPNIPLQNLDLISRIPGLRNGTGVTYELRIPEAFRRRSV
ncbi:alkaline phosphatase PhoX [Algiphilus aromaticivorans]|uniref:alkaline phosphatase PhoX n=1 Tax=Algiphilus aromaticivorans TaxID=382454 RepID=UPI0005C2054C|nr:alkaline phosphatase PhoX [Algiphilus aromaticivorans]